MCEVNIYTMYLLTNLSAQPGWATRSIFKQCLTGLNSELFALEQEQVNMFVTIFTNPSAQAGYGTRSIFKQCLTGLNSEFSFS